MKARASLGIISLLALSLTSCLDKRIDPLTRGQVTVQQLKREPFPTQAKVEIDSPKNSSDVMSVIEIEVNQIPLGTVSETSQKTDLFKNLKDGQEIRVVIDGSKNFLTANEEENRSSIGQDTSEYFESKIQLKHNFGNGSHVIRAFAVKPWGESLKGPRVFSAVSFVNGGGDKIDISKPYLTYNEPSGNRNYQAGEPILVDFLLSNTELSGGRYVKLKIDGHEETLKEWAPYKLLINRPGTYTLSLTLHEPTGAEITPLFKGENSRSIVVK